MNEVSKLITWEVISVRTETLVGGDAVKTEADVVRGGFASSEDAPSGQRERERERERRRLWWDWNLLVTEREKRCPSWWVWIGGGFRSSLCHGEDGGDAVRSKRIVVLRGGFRSALCHGEDEKMITKPDGVSVVEDRCGGSVMGLNHSSVSSLFVTENTK